jgi:hypothetical protein
MKCSCGKEIQEGEIFSLIINGKIVDVCGDCWWASLKPKGKENERPS